MNRIKIRICGWFRIGAVLAGAIASVSVLPAGEPAAKPNIVVLFVDDLGWAEVGFQGPHHQTPHIDALARSGMVFTRAYAASPACSPSRSGFVTGRHPAELGIVRHLADRNPEGREFAPSVDDPAGLPSRNRLPAGAQTYGHALQRLGYHTAHHGKWHLGDEKYHPIHFGFHEQAGVTNRGLAVSHLAPFWPDQTYADAPPGTYLADRQADDAIAFIQANTRRRFLLSLWFYGVHSPVIGRPDYVAEAKRRGLTGEMAEFDGMVRAVDDAVGRILRTLEAAGLRDNTLVLLTSDQGSYFERPPLRGSKIRTTALFEGGARVPFMVSWPGRVRPGTTCAQPISLTDVFPTLVEAAGGEPTTDPKLDGRSLLPVLLGRGGVARERLISYRSYDNQYAAVVEGPWKLIAHRDGHHELYHVLNDTAERSDRAAAEPELTRRLVRQLADWEDSLGLRLAPHAKLPAGTLPRAWQPGP
ncbi:MAG: sulfatase-like hydrolase/transferase [Verrucomicrobiota bacterium]